MAIARSALAGSQDTSNVSSYATASVTPTANALVLVAIANSDASAAATPTLSGNGLTYVQVGTVTYDGGIKRVTVFRAMGAAPSAGAITIDFAGDPQTGCCWSVAEYTGVNITGSNGANAVRNAVSNTAATGTSLTITLAAFADTLHATYCAIAHNVNEAHVAGASFLIFHNTRHGTPAHAMAVEDQIANDTSADQTWATSAASGGWALEIVSLQTIAGNLLTNTATLPNATVTPGAVTVSANLLTNTASLPNGAVSQVVADQTVSANLLTDSASLPNATVTPGSVSVSANLLTDTATLPSASVTPGAVTVSANLLTNSATLPSGTVTPGSVSVAGSLLTDSATLPNAAVSPGAVSVAGNLLSNPASLLSAVVTPGAVSVAAALLTNAATLHEGDVSATSEASIAADILTISVLLPSGVVTPGAVSVAADLNSNPATLYEAVVTFIPGRMARRERGSSEKERERLGLTTGYR